MTIQTINTPIQVKSANLPLSFLFLSSLSLSSRRFFSATLCLVLLVGMGVLGANEARAEYTPPQGPPPEVPTVSNGSRGNCSNVESTIPLTVLAPFQHVGQTTATNPTLALFLPATKPYQLSVNFYSSETGDLVKSVEQVVDPVEHTVDHTPGLVIVSFAEDELELMAGRRYIWEVAIACDFEQGQVGYDLSSFGELDVVSQSDAIATALTIAQTPQERSVVYAEAGYWFDALHAALADVETSDHQETLSTLLLDLADVEVSPYNETLQQVAEQLLSEPQRSSENNQ